LLIAVFAGWVVSRVIVREQLADLNEELYRGWLWLMRFFVPLALLVVLLNAAGVL